MRPTPVRPPRTRTSWPRLGSAAAALVLALAACGGGPQDKGAAAPVPGVTDEPCPKAVNPDNGCIYLGIISDLSSGPFSSLGKPITMAQQAFWRRVNQQGGIGGYDIDATTYVRDNKYDVATHKRAYQEIRTKVLALAQTLGSPTTAAVLPQMRADKMVAAPASWTSLWEFEDVLIKSGTNYCFEAMNAVDHAVEAWGIDSVMAVHYPGDYGGDAAGGARIAAERNRLKFTDVPTPTGADKQRPAIDKIVKESPDLVLLSTSPRDTAVLIGQAAARGYRGRFIGSSPSWTKELLGIKTRPAAEAIRTRFLQAAPWKPFATDTPGHAAMRAALGKVDPNDAYTTGWIWSYPLKTVLQKAIDQNRLTRAGLYQTLRNLGAVDYEGMLSTERGAYPGVAATSFRATTLNVPDDNAHTGVRTARDFFTGPTARRHVMTEPCFKAS
ncbi:ABC transporter substrate-binding protein [Thermomonospora curvata]|uniref:ABC-type branched-chain amino acid transport systems periplasmic component-like protein n=2 Tax=Thermomonospora TaxID=2019 RepID=D1ACR5_THECD|nr:ABC transporter substrate-binding protein [Thermomonospora curvata]ACY97404.1 ABC-type branched-chain amino acid transport systems periplasmic component-like protein [Thermomonospora curvata DSM 43183]